MTGSLKKACGKKTKKECEHAFSSCKYTKKNSSNYCKNSNKKPKIKRRKSSKISSQTKRKYIRRNRKTGTEKNRVNIESVDSSSYYNDSMPGKQELVLNFDNSAITSTNYPAESNELVIEFDSDVSKTQINQFKNRKTPFVIDDIERLTPNTDNILINSINKDNSNNNPDNTQFNIDDVEMLIKR